jgi:hypothetical protein
MRIHFVFHVSLLGQPYHVFIIVGKIHDPPSPIENNGEHGYKVKDIWIQGSLIINSNILFISMGMIWENAFGNQ